MSCAPFSSLQLSPFSFLLSYYFSFLFFSRKLSLVLSKNQKQQNRPLGNQPISNQPQTRLVSFLYMRFIVVFGIHCVLCYMSCAWTELLVCENVCEKQPTEHAELAYALNTTACISMNPLCPLGSLYLWYVYTFY